MEPIGLVEWRSDYESGIAEIDEQHKHIIETLNKLYYAVQDNRIEQEVNTLIEELDFYTSAHFALEEGYARKYGFPEFDELKKSHNFFRNTYLEMRSHYHYRQANPESLNSLYIRDYPGQYALQLLSVMNGWFVFHINTIDRALFSFLRDRL